MCQLTAYTTHDGRETLLLENVTAATVEGRHIHLADLFGAHKAVEGRIKSIEGNSLFVEPAPVHEHEPARDDAAKLGVLLEHWVEHNDSHNREIQQWADRAGTLGRAAVQDEIVKAMANAQEVSRHLRLAREALSASPV